MKFSRHSLASAAALFALLAFASTAWPQATGSFEELAGRAQSLVDSKPSEAADLFKQALALRADWAEGWLYYGACLYQLQRYAEATDAFRKGVALTPNKGTGWAFLGLAEAEMDNSDQAIADIQKGESLGLAGNWPFEVAVRTRAAQLLARSSSFDEATAQLAPIAKKGDNSPELQQTMGLCAMAVPQAFSELSPERRAVVALAGKAAWDLISQRPTDAVASYQELLQRYPDEPGVHYAYGLYFMETDLKAAYLEFGKEVQKYPQNWTAQIVYGSMQGRNGDAEAALQSLRQGLKYAPAKYRWLCHAELGRANLTAGNVDAAIAEFENAERLMGGNAQIHFFLAQAYRRAGRKADAQRETAQFEKLKAQEDPLGVPGLRALTFGADK